MHLLTRGMTVCDMRTLTEEGKTAFGGREADALAAIETEARALVHSVIDTILQY